MVRHPESSVTRIGLLSDTHGRVEIAAAAVRALTASGVQAIIHLGDVGSIEVLEELLAADLPGGVHVVFGNCDHDEPALRRHAERLGIVVHHPLGTLEVDGRTIAFSHGHLPHLLEAAAREGADYLLHGHTHVQRDERSDGRRIVNPGALHRAARHTVAVLDPGLDLVEFIEIDGPEATERCRP